MLHFLKENISEKGNEELMGLKGVQRDELLIKFWVHQNRHKDSKKQGINERHVGKLSQKMTDINEHGEEGWTRPLAPFGPRS